MVTARETRQRVHGMTFSYELEKYPFREELEKLFGIELQDLHLWLGNFEKFDRKNDQQTIVPFAYQVIPTFRVGLPGNRFVGEYHTDAKYNHPDFELNFNIGLSNNLMPCCLMSEKISNTRKYYPLECENGEIFSFNHIDCVHGSEINTTDQTMVSMDFRVAMIPFYEEIDA